jgi:hypothetical protein
VIPTATGCFIFVCDHRNPGECPARLHLIADTLPRAAAGFLQSRAAPARGLFCLPWLIRVGSFRFWFGSEWAGCLISLTSKAGSWGGRRGSRSAVRVIFTAKMSTGVNSKTHKFWVSLPHTQSAKFWLVPSASGWFGSEWAGCLISLTSKPKAGSC